MRLRLTDLKEGDLVIVGDPINIDGRLARVEKLTRDGKLLIRRRRNSGRDFGVLLEVSLDEVLRVEVRV